MGTGIMFTLAEVASVLSVALTVFILIIGFFMKRSVFKEIDDLKEYKQDKAMCDQIEDQRCREREELRTDLKDGRSEFRYIHQKIDKIMFKLQIPIPERSEER